MKKKIIKEVTVEQEVIETLICDVCQKDIKENQSDIYFTVHTYHKRWGNDSWESSKHFDLCSRQCLDKHYKEFFDGTAYSDSYDIEVERTKFIGN